MKTMIQKLTLVAMLATMAAVPARAADAAEPISVTVTAARAQQSSLVVGLPYSATETRTTYRVLADGNRITDEVLAKVYRNGSGQTRTDTLDKKGVIERTSLAPGDGWRYYLDHKRKSLTRYAIPTAQEARAMLEDLRERRPVSSSFVSNKLGEREIEGLLASGSESRSEIEANTDGNSLPITRTGETWHSKELRITLLRKSSDPRYGETVVALSNIERDEPDAALFVVPSDYKGL